MLVLVLVLVLVVALLVEVAPLSKPVTQVPQAVLRSSPGGLKAVLPEGLGGWPLRRASWGGLSPQRGCDHRLITFVIKITIP